MRKKLKDFVFAVPKMGMYLIEICRFDKKGKFVSKAVGYLEKPIKKIKKEGGDNSDR